jgi:alkylated DNA repair dioxygenase AlkB
VLRQTPPLQEANPQETVALITHTPNHQAHEKQIFGNCFHNHHFISPCVGDYGTAIRPSAASMRVAKKPYFHQSVAILFVLLQWWSCPSHSFSAQKAPTFADLQQCVTPDDMLHNVGAHLPCGSSQEHVLLLSSTLLVRLSKQVVGLDNHYRYSVPTSRTPSVVEYQNWSWDPLENVVKSFISSGAWNQSPKTIEAAIDGLKAAAVLARLCPNLPISFLEPLVQRWKQETPDSLQAHQLSGIKWAMDCFQSVGMTEASLSEELQSAFDALSLPFCVRPGALAAVNDLTVPNLLDQVDFQVDVIKTSSNKIVPERRETAWEGDETVAPFEYSGKSMPRRPWSPLVRAVRDSLEVQTGIYYDGCLLNHYPDGESGMRYHVDPDQGTLWDFSTAVVSVGATRKFAFRDTLGSKPHVFTLLQGDCTEMFDDCQTRFQHTVKTAETPNEQAARASLVFKKTL